MTERQDCPRCGGRGCFACQMYGYVLVDTGDEEGER